MAVWLGLSLGVYATAAPGFYSPTAESFGVSAQIGSGVVRGPEVRFREGSTKVPPGFHQGSTRVHTRVPLGFHQGSTAADGESTKKSTACCWGYHLSLLFFLLQKEFKKGRDGYLGNLFLFGNPDLTPQSSTHSPPVQWNCCRGAGKTRKKATHLHSA